MPRCCDELKADALQAGAKPGELQQNRRALWQPQSHRMRALCPEKISLIFPGVHFSGVRPLSPLSPC